MTYTTSFYPDDDPANVLMVTDDGDHWVGHIIARAALTDKYAGWAMVELAFKSNVRRLAP